jgi:putative transposase
MRFAAIQRQRDDYKIGWMCARLNVSRSGYYAWLDQSPSNRAKRDQQLKVAISAIHAENLGVYGSPRITDELRERGEPVSRKRVARLMREEGLSGDIPRRFVRTTDSRHSHPIAENLVRRQFDVSKPNQLWAADITYVRTWEGWLYVAVVIDLYSRRVIGWAAADHMRTELALDALTMAIICRGAPEDIVHHSDRGSQYASAAYQERLEKLGIRPSMSRKGDCWDNAVVESFFATLKRELIYRRAWPTRISAKVEINKYVDCFYNSRRRHSTLGGMSPMKYEMSRCQHALAA